MGFWHRLVSDSHANLSTGGLGTVGRGVMVNDGASGKTAEMVAGK